MIRAYTATAKWFHWLVFFVVSFELLTAAVMASLPRGAAKLSVVNVHMSFGAVLIVLMIARLWWRVSHAPPPLPKGTPPRHIAAARLVHAVFYVLLFIIPFAGWIWANAIGWQVSIFGMIPLPMLVAKGSPLVHLAGEVHEILAWGIAVLMVLHVLASLYHWYVKRDDLLESMLPGDKLTTGILTYCARFRGSVR
jgi:cytochrome b561